MLHFAPDGGLAMLDVPFPVKGIIAHFGQALGTARDSEVNVGKMLIPLDFSPLLHAQIPGIPIYNFVIFTNQACCLCNVVPVCRGDGYCVNQAAACIHANMALHAEAPFISLFRLVHFRVAGLIRVFCGAGRVNAIHFPFSFGAFPDRVPYPRFLWSWVHQ